MLPTSVLETYFEIFKRPVRYIFDSFIYVLCAVSHKENYSTMEDESAYLQIWCESHVSVFINTCLQSAQGNQCILEIVSFKSVSGNEIYVETMIFSVFTAASPNPANCYT